MEADRPPILLSRTPAANAPLRAALMRAGQTVLEWPALRLVPESAAAEPLRVALRSARAVVVPSPGAAEALVALASDAARQPHPGDWYAPGPGTRSRWHSAGGAARDWQPVSPPDACGLAAALLSRPAVPTLLLEGSQPRPLLSTALHAAGRSFQRLRIYRNEAPAALAHPSRSLAAAVYCSPSAARRLFQANPWLRRTPAIAIGQTTAGWLREAGACDLTIAPSPDLDGLLSALAERLGFTLER